LLSFAGMFSYRIMKEPLVIELIIPHTSPTTYIYHYPKDMSPKTDVIENISLLSLLLLLTNSENFMEIHSG
jgi:hypothetical protein